MRLFEIPVYALSEKVLKQRVSEEYARYYDSIPEGAKCDLEFVQKCFNITAFPARIWEYNHIIGYMVVRKKNYDVLLDWYAPVPALQKYRWISRRKHFVQNTHITGRHFYIGNMKSGDELRTRLFELITDFARQLEKERHYYADLEAFHNIDTLLDYEKLLRG